jgi:flagellin
MGVSLSGSINTNSGALAALASLRRIDSQLSIYNKQLQTGYRVADALDDASTFAVAQGIRGEVQAFTAVQSSLASGVGLASVTQAALTGVSNASNDLYAKTVELSSGSISANQRTQYAIDYTAIQTQISNFLTQANFGGANLLSAGSVSKTFLADVSSSNLSLSTQSGVSAAYTVFNATSVASASSSTAALATITGFQSAVATALAANAAESRQLTLQSNFNNSVVDAQTTALGVLVDADIGKAAARVQALQVSRQLAIQSLSIANEQPRQLLGLFPTSTR